MLFTQPFFVSSKHPINQFIYPLDIPVSIIGNFGECRPNHFHSGIDMRTEAKENAKVHAIADGYVSRIKIGKSGFGNAIFITHPNGYTSLYAHLNKFFPTLQKFVLVKQYDVKS